VYCIVQENNWCLLTFSQTTLIFCSRNANYLNKPLLNYVVNFSEFPILRWITEILVRLKHI